MTTYRDLCEAFRGELTTLIQEGQFAEPITDPASPASNYGMRPRPSLERLGTSFTALRFSNNIVTCPKVPFNLTYAIGLLLWCLAGSDDQEMIAYYRGKPPTERKVSFGQRMIRSNGERDLLHLAIDRIRLDSGTRRGYVPIFSAEDLFQTGEIPCAIGFHLHHRQGALHGVTLMRAQNAITSLTMDVFLFSTVLRFLAAKTGFTEGTYTHLCSTFHAFTDDLGQLDPAKGADITPTCVGLGSMDHFDADLPKLLNLESGLRAATLAQHSVEIQRYSHEAANYQSEAAAAIAACLTSISMRRAGNNKWTHPLLKDDLAAILGRSGDA